MTKPIARHDFQPERFPITILVSKNYLALGFRFVIAVRDSRGLKLQRQDRRAGVVVADGGARRGAIAREDRDPELQGHRALPVRAVYADDTTAAGGMS